METLNWLGRGIEYLGLAAGTAVVANIGVNIIERCEPPINQVGLRKLPELGGHCAIGMTLLLAQLSQPDAVFAFATIIVGTCIGLLISAIRRNLKPSRRRLK